MTVKYENAVSAGKAWKEEHGKCREAYKNLRVI